ncbi:MAG: hypothetical protein HETSPECPRED_001232 [Heterodermia speciosa]|uniref:Uncharacterized protein n=1 Tax=Heterodermia speciosa TaxID=116794 RepID=A0A8H3EWV7_9LECA|nr:MAG: hypothetical protein HETSPECPRED_001232 [Heterodermia speciosa]
MALFDFNRTLHNCRTPKRQKSMPEAQKNCDLCEGRSLSSAADRAAWELLVPQSARAVVILHVGVYAYLGLGLLAGVEVGAEEEEEEEEEVEEVGTEAEEVRVMVRVMVRVRVRIAEAASEVEREEGGEVSQEVTRVSLDIL